MLSRIAVPAARRASAAMSAAEKASHAGRDPGEVEPFLERHPLSHGGQDGAPRYLIGRRHVDESFEGPGLRRGRWPEDRLRRRRREVRAPHASWSAPEGEGERFVLRRQEARACLRRRVEALR
jgi:hypothetical protein